jgi:hypothetical protein
MYDDASIVGGYSLDVNCFHQRLTQSETTGDRRQSHSKEAVLARSKNKYPHIREKINDLNAPWYAMVQ